MTTYSFREGRGGRGGDRKKLNIGWDCRSRTVRCVAASALYLGVVLGALPPFWVVEGSVVMFCRGCVAKDACVAGGVSAADK